MIYILLTLLIITLIYFIFTKNDLDKDKIIEGYLKEIESLDSKSIIDESLIVLLTIYKAELSRSDTERWVHICKFDKIDNIYKILPKLIKLGYITNINESKNGSPLLIINYDGISIIEFNNLFIFYTKKIKSLFIIKLLLTIKLNKNTGLFPELKEMGLLQK
jgi:hypothetical protein